MGAPESASSPSWRGRWPRVPESVRRRPLTSARTALALGAGNIARVMAYRLGLRAGIHPAQRIAVPALPSGPFFDPPRAIIELTPPTAWNAAPEYFGWFRPDATEMPDWHRNPFNGVGAPPADRPWWSMPDFDRRLGDVKTVWESSRFDWVVAFAQSASAGDPAASPRLQAWLADWCDKNPPYRGLNWKCGQETSLRVLHLAVAALVLGQTREPRPALAALVAMHLRRIAPTMSYARAQDNNHGTSEAAALFVGGSWLASLGTGDADRWAREGRRWLEERAQRLILPDGSFSQHSVNYHRLMLDTYSLAELWRRRLDLPAFDRALYERAAAATEWLRAFTVPDSGDAPVLGGNDGANLLPLTDAGYRDYRPSVALAAALFLDGGDADAASPDAAAQLRWLGVPGGTRTLRARDDRLFPDGGYGILRRGRAMAMLRFPRFRFRPAHADALHLDFWLGADNLLRDGGSFSYADSEWDAYFSGAAGHNVVQFDGQEQMPRLGRFLWGDWLRTSMLEPIVRRDAATSMAAGYRDGHGHEHVRRVALAEDSLTVTDEVRGVTRHAVLRWRLRPGPWTLHDRVLSDGVVSLTLSATTPIVRCEVVPGWESRFYLQRTAVPVLELEVASEATITSVLQWAA